MLNFSLTNALIRKSRYPTGGRGLPINPCWALAGLVFSTNLPMYHMMLSFYQQHDLIFFEIVNIERKAFCIWVAWIHRIHSGIKSNLKPERKPWKGKTYSSLKLLMKTHHITKNIWNNFFQKSIFCIWKNSMITCGIFVLLQNFKGCFGTILILYTASTQYSSIIKQTFPVSAFLVIIVALTILQICCLTRLMKALFH